MSIDVEFVVTLVTIKLTKTTLDRAGTLYAVSISWDRVRELICNSYVQNLYSFLFHQKYKYKASTLLRFYKAVLTPVAVLTLKKYLHL